MTENHVRRRLHEAYFNEFELAALQPVFTRLGKDLGDFTRENLRDFLRLHYNLPHGDRGDVNKVLAGFHLAKRTLGTVQRHEIGVHAKDPDFLRAIARMVDGDPEDSVKGLRGLLDDLLLFAKRGY
jgi:hypothetical protein